MAKKKEKPAPAATPEGADAPKKKRSKLKLAIFALVPLLVGGGGYFGYTTFMGGDEAAASAEAVECHEGEECPEATADGEHGTDATYVAALPPEIAAEGSFTYAYALSELLKDQCGDMHVEALKVASEEEGMAGGPLVNLSWTAAIRRLSSLTQRSCDMMYSEIGAADAKAMSIADAKAAALKAAEGGDEASGGHH